MSKGRGNSSAETINRALRINIDVLRKSLDFTNGFNTGFIQTWQNGSSVNGVLNLSENEKILILKFAINGISSENRIRIVEKQSNLGKGYLYYFICPYSGIKCKSIYCAYNSNYFKSLKSYQNRIYYPSQTCSQAYKINQRYFQTEDKINQIYQQKNCKYYKGIETKRHKRLIKLINKRIALDNLRELELDKYLRKLIDFDYYEKQG